MISNSWTILTCTSETCNMWWTNNLTFKFSYLHTNMMNSRHIISPHFDSHFFRLKLRYRNFANQRNSSIKIESHKFTTSHDFTIKMTVQCNKILAHTWGLRRDPIIFGIWYTILSVLHKKNCFQDLNTDPFNNVTITLPLC